MKIVNIELPDQVYKRLRDEADIQHRSLRAHVAFLLSCADLRDEMKLPQTRLRADPRSIA